jgi:C-terminal processing protease CtpA/Prc
MSAQQVAQRIVNQQATRLTLQKQPQVTTHIVRFGHGKYCSGLHIRRGTVERVDPNSPASTTGIRTGDVVVRVNSTATVMMADSAIMGLVDRKKKETATLVQTMPRAVFEEYTRGVRDLNTLKGGV